MSDLPTGWVDTTIGDVVVPKVEQRTPLADEDFIYIDISSVDRVTKKIVNPQKLSGKDAPSRARQVVASGDVLVSMTRPNLNAVAMVSKDLDGQIASTGFDVLRAKNVESRWLYYIVRTNDFVTAMSDLVQGALYPAVRPRDIRNFEIPLAPLDEQKRIAEKLDSLLARVDSCQTHLERVPQILKRFRQSVLAAATSGRLSDDWREAHPSLVSGNVVINSDREKKEELLLKNKELAKKKSTLFSDINAEYLFDIPSGWAFTSWGKISEWITYGFTRPMPSASEGKKLVTAKDVQNFSLELESAGFTTKKAFDDLSDKDRPLRGDLLITKDGTIGRAVLVQTDEPFCINQSVAVCWLRTTQMNKKYLEIVANADFTQRFVKDMAQGMAIQHLSITDFAQCPVPVPSLEEQAEIVRRVEKLFAYAERLEARYTSASEHVERLTPSLLAKAFRGELVSQEQG